MVDIDAAAEALKSGHLAGAAFDVFPSEVSANRFNFLYISLETELNGPKENLTFL